MTDFLDNPAADVPASPRATHGRRIDPSDRRAGPTSRTPRVAYVIGRFPSLTTTFIERELAALDELGVDVQVLSIREPDGGSGHTGRSSGSGHFPTHLLALPRTQMVRAHLHFLRSEPVTYVRTLAYLGTRTHRSLRSRAKTLLHFAEGVVAAYLLRDGSFDHVHAHFVDRGSTVAMCVSRLLGIPYSLTAHARSIFADPVLLPEKLAGARFVVTVSEFNKAHLASLVPHLDDSYIHVLHPWVDLTRFEPREQRPVRPRLHIASVGRLTEKKGHEHLIRACALLGEDGVDVECHIVGDGPLRGQLEDLVDELALRDVVHLHGARQQPTVRALLRDADVFVLACVVATNGDRDAMPVAIAEAMATGIPVISTTIVGISEMVKPGTGFLVPPADPRRLAEAIHRIDGLDPDERARMGARARAVITDGFDLRDGTRRLAELYEDAAHASRAGGVGRGH